MKLTPKFYHVLNLGVGVQSTRLYLMFSLMQILDAYDVPVRLDAAIFADPKWERRKTYKHLEWLKSLGGPSILVPSAGSLGDHLANGTNSSGGRFASIPAFTKKPNGQIGKVRRQCTKEYKVIPIEQAIRRQVLGLKPRQRVPKGVHIIQYVGFSLEEAGRARRMSVNPARKHKWCSFRFPLIEMNQTRADCERWLSNVVKVPHKVVRSSCVFCPFHSDAEWVEIKKDPEDWKRAVFIDEQLRKPGNVFNRNMNAQMFLHPSCKPLVQIKFDPKDITPRAIQTNLGFTGECLGVCGT